MVDETMFKTIPEKIDDEILVYLDNCDSMKSYFDEDGSKTCFDTIELINNVFCIKIWL